MMVSPALHVYFARMPETDISAFASRISFLSLHNSINLSTKPSSMHCSFSFLKEPTIAVVGSGNCSREEDS